MVQKMKFFSPFLKGRSDEVGRGMFIACACLHMLMYSCAYAQTIHVQWTPNTEPDMKEYTVFFWAGADTTAAGVDYVHTVQHDAEADTLRTTFVVNTMEGLWMVAGLRAVDQADNASDMGFSPFVQVPDRPPGMPADIILRIK